MRGLQLNKGEHKSRNKGRRTKSIISLPCLVALALTSINLSAPKLFVSRVPSSFSVLQAANIQISHMIDHCFVSTNDHVPEFKSCTTTGDRCGFPMLIHLERSPPSVIVPERSPRATVRCCQSAVFVRRLVRREAM